jgi:hypothetical protein
MDGQGVATRQALGYSADTLQGTIFNGKLESNAK